MLIVGLTGSIGMGKTTVAGWFRRRGFPVSDSDQVVHELYQGAAVAPVEAAFSGTTTDGAVDRQLLTKALLADPTGFARLEEIVHPLVREAQRSFLAECAAEGSTVAILEIPLLFETMGDAWVDLVVVADAASEIQRRRVLERPGMTEEKFDRILSRQLDASEKRRRADFVVDTGLSLPESEAQVDAIAAILRMRKGTAYQRLWGGSAPNSGG